MCNLTLTSMAVEDARQILPMTSLKEIMVMAQNSAIVTHPEGNRRYKDVVFRIYEGVIMGITRFSAGVAEEKKECIVCGGIGKLVFYESCECTMESDYEEGGCIECSDGLRRREYNCPSCSGV